jgi:hypothetical protein
MTGSLPAEALAVERELLLAVVMVLLEVAQVD